MPGESQATAHLEQALATAGTDSRTVIAASAALALAYAESDRAERAVEVLERSLSAIGARTAELPRTDALGTIEPEALRDARLAVIAEAGIARVGMMNESSAPAALHRAEELRARLDTIADPPVYLLVALAYHAARSNRGDDAQQLAERALACAPYPPPLDIAHVLVATLTMIECLDAAQRLCDDLLAAARRHGAMRETVAILAARASASCARGALADAEADARWALERADGIQRVHALSDVIRVLTERDALEAAEDELERVGEDPAASRSDEVVRFLLARGRLRAAQGRLHEALEDFHACGRRCERLGRERQSTVPWRSEAALIHAARGELAEARRLATEQLELARSFGRPRALGLALRALGLVEGGESGRRLLSQAVETLERSAATIELARALCDHGAALRRLGRRVQARTALEHALDLAYHCGARRIAARARAELIAAGAKPRRDAITGRDALTDAELRVARLAADGLTNREIAQALFITTKTAKAHLTRVYRKLDISRRAELNSALTGLVDGNRRAPSRSVAIS